MLKGYYHAAVFLYEARDTDISTLSNFCKGRMIVTKNKKLLQASCVLTDINKF